MLGFDTIGNATVIVYDDKPVLATDPWFEGAAYFGSWGLPYEVPDEQKQAIRQASFVWISHGHPDHLSSESLETLRDRTILLPDHVGNRIRDDLRGAGFDVRVLRDRHWERLSPNVRVFCISDYFQDAVLLIDVGGTLLVNINDASDRGWGRIVRKIIRGYDRSFLLKLFGYGDVDMINLFNEQGVREVPNAVHKRPLGPQLEFYASLYGVTDVVPFSCFHRYQRSDSIWANELVTPLSALSEGRSDPNLRLHPAFIRYNCRSGESISLNPPKNPVEVVEPAVFGDNWSEPLEADEVQRLRRYMLRFEVLADALEFVRFRVGGVDTTIDLGAKHSGRGLTFEVPRGSLMTAVEYEVFDDLLIGNFMKTTMHGDFVQGEDSLLHPHFTPPVAKFGDNGKAHTRAELRAYFRAYKRRAPVDHLLHTLERESERRVRAFVGHNTPAFKAAKRIYLMAKGNRRTA